MRADADGSGNLFSLPLREIVLLSTLVAVFATLVASAVNGYAGAGLWYLVLRDLRSFLPFSFLIVTGLFLLSMAGRRIAPGRFARRRFSPGGIVKYGFWPCLAVCGAALILSPFLRRDSQGKNILLITIDTLRADHLSVYGYERLTSPHMDDFARKSLVFTNAIVQWPKTSPSFASMLTSMYSGQAGVTGPRQRLPRRRTTTAEALSNAGYTTAAVVGNGNLGAGFTFDQGFSTYVEAWKDHSVPDDENCDATHITDLALETLESIRGKGDFFFWVHYVDPHAPYSPPDPFREMFVNDAFYAEQKIRLNEGFNEDIGGCPLRSRLGENDNLHYYIAEYDAEIRYCDSQIQHLFAYLDQHDLWQTTMVILTSDHGESLGEHNYYFEHGKLSYDTTLRVPFIVRAPGCRVGTVDMPIALLDLHPTILEYAGLGAGREAEGESLLAMLHDGGAGGQRWVFAQAGGEREQSWAVRDNERKLIYVPSEKYRNLMKGALYELYDLRSDPGETLNLFAPGDTAALELKRELDQWVARQDGKTAQLRNQLDADDESTEENLKALGYIE
jgi:arylsulfatase A-like enzyme